MKFDNLINEIKAQHVKYEPLDKDSEIIFDNDNIKIVQIYTQDGLNKYAKNTKWRKSSPTFAKLDEIDYMRLYTQKQHLGWNLFVLINKKLTSNNPNAKMVFYITQTESTNDGMYYNSKNEKLDYTDELNKLLIDNNVNKELLGIFDDTSYDYVLLKIEKKVPLNQILQIQQADMIFQSEDALQILAIDTYKDAVKFIVNPSIGVQLYAVRKDGMNILSLIKNKVKLTYEVELAAAKQNGMVLQYVPEPISKDVLMAAVQQNGHVIGVLIDRKLNVDKELMIAAVSESGSAIESIIDAGVVPTPDLIKIAIANKHNPISMQEVNKLIGNLQK